MSFTYLNNPKDRKLDAVRLELGDTTEQTHLIEDEEIEYLLERASDSVLGAAARGADAIAAKFAREETVRFSGSSVDKAAAQQHYSDLANALRARIASPDAFVVNARNAGQYQRNATNKNAVHGSFYRGMFSGRAGGSYAIDIPSEKE